MTGSRSFRRCLLLQSLLLLCQFHAGACSAAGQLLRSPSCLLLGPAGQVRQLSSCCERILLENQLLRQQLQMHQGQMGLQVMSGQQLRVNTATHLVQVRVSAVIAADQVVQLPAV